MLKKAWKIVLAVVLALLVVVLGYVAYVFIDYHRIGDQELTVERNAAATVEAGKEYGILSVLLQAWYDIEYLFTVGEKVFNPPPKVKSAVIRLRRNGVVRSPVHGLRSGLPPISSASGRFCSSRMPTCTCCRRWTGTPPAVTTWMRSPC